MKITREAKIGAFLIIVIILSIWGFNYLKGINIFKTSKNFIAIYEDINGLKEAAPIFLNGYKVGMVDEIYSKEKDGSKITVEIAIKEKIDIPNNSEIFIFDDGFLGSKAVRLIMGDSKNFLEYGDTITGKIEGGAFDEIKMQFSGLATEFDSIAGTIQVLVNKGLIDDLHGTFDNLNSFSKALNNSSYKLQSAIANLEDITAKKDTISKIIDNFAAISDSLSNAKIKSAIENANQLLSQADSLIYKINSGEGTAGLLINDSTLYNNLSSVASSMDSLLVDLKEHPGRYVHLSLFGGNKEDKKDK